MFYISTKRLCRQGTKCRLIINFYIFVSVAVTTLIIGNIPKYLITN